MGIETRPCFNSLCDMPPYKKYKHSKSLDNSKLLSKQGISLPSSTKIKKSQLEHIVNIFLEQLKLNIDK